MRSILVGLCALTVAAPVLARGPVHVRGYTTKSGTYVAPHYRSAPDHSRFNNWSTIGNVNPYTGQAGTKNPYSGTYAPYRYTTPAYSVPSYSYSPSYTPPSYGPEGLRANPAADQFAPGSILLPSGVVKVPAKTASGYCLQTPDDYVATGDLNYPVITHALPRCENVDNVKKRKRGIWQPLKG
jgi:hypothetical protein